MPVDFSGPAGPEASGRGRAALFLCALALSATTLAKSPQELQAPIRANVEVVNVDVTVTDGKGNFVRGLRQLNFRVLDNGAEQPITHFNSIDSPAAMLVMVETSPAVFLLHRQHLQAAYALVEGLAPHDQVALASYDVSPRMLLPFSTDKRELQAALRGLRYNMGSSELHFYEAVEAALDGFALLPGKKALVLLTTGLDSSTRTWESLAERLRSSEVTVYAVALGGELRDYREESNAGGNRTSFQEADRALKEMAEITGGQVFFPRRAGELEEIYRAITSTLRHRYSLGFAPPAHDGQFHGIFVQLLDDQGRLLGPDYPELRQPGEKPARKSGPFPKHVKYRIFARRGYVAPEPPGQ